MKAKKCLREFFCPALTYYNLNIRACLIVLLLLPGLSVIAQKSVYRVTGKVISASDKQPLAGAPVKIEGQNKIAYTDNNGYFSLASSLPKGNMLVNFLGFKPATVSFDINSIDSITISLVQSENMLEEVQISTGYQAISPERMTGSYTRIDGELLTRRVSTSILERLDGVTSGLIFPKNTAVGSTANEPSISIRGRSTIFANAEPLIIVDNFPFEGDISSINPQDVVAINVLKDASSASIWGARSGNGVIVITTKKGKTGGAPVVSFSANSTIGQRPDLYYAPQLSSSDFVDVETFLFNKGRFNSRINTGYQVISPVVEVLNDLKKGKIDSVSALSKIDAFRTFDVRQQVEDNFYQNAFNQQYHLNVSGGSMLQQYFLSAGYDNNKGNTVGNGLERYTLNASNSYSLLNNKLTISANLAFAQNKSHSSQIPSLKYPYEPIADAGGNALKTTSYSYRTAYTDTVGKGYLLDWSYRPLEEFSLLSSPAKDNDLRMNLSVDYKIIPGLSASFRYQYRTGNSESSTLYDKNSFFVRNTVNLFSQINYATGAVTRPVPPGDISRKTTGDYTGNYGRAQLTYTKDWGPQHAITAMIAAEMNEFKNSTQRVHLYGYDPETASNTTVDFITLYPQITTGSGVSITNDNDQWWIVDRFRSWLGNLSYTYSDRYTVYGSLRRDESNLFGVATNNKGVPLWSAGASWQINKEAFYTSKWLPVLKLRVSTGVQGNVDKSVSAYTTAQNLNYTSTYGLPISAIVNPPNPSLRWEKVRNLNIGIDFTGKNHWIEGSIDMYRKNGTDLIANSPIAGQTGLTEFRGNAADLETKGIDVDININWLRHTFKWTTAVLFTYVKDKVTDYKVKQSNNLDYIKGNYNNPYEGYPYSALFSFKYGGLDANGDPQGYLNGDLSKDYTALTATTGLENLVYHGTTQPVQFGSVRNSLDYKNMSLSFNITYKFDYFFRRSSLNNTSLYATEPVWKMADYEKRWQKPGDEAHTNVPSLVYTPNSSRDNFYTYSDVLVEKGDHVRLQDIRLAYTLSKRRIRRLPVSSLQVYTYVNNVAMLWRANGYHLDPDVFQTSYPSPTTWSFGLSTSF